MAWNLDKIVNAHVCAWIHPYLQYCEWSTGRRMNTYLAYNFLYIIIYIMNASSLSILVLNYGLIWI